MRLVPSRGEPASEDCILGKMGRNVMSGQQIPWLCFVCNPPPQLEYKPVAIRGPGIRGEMWCLQRSAVQSVRRAGAGRTPATSALDLQYIYHRLERMRDGCAPSSSTLKESPRLSIVLFGRIGIAIDMFLVHLADNLLRASDRGGGGACARSLCFAESHYHCFVW